jgi:hypothetical protein
MRLKADSARQIRECDKMVLAYLSQGLQRKAPPFEIYRNIILQNSTDVSDVASTFSVDE